MMIYNKIHSLFRLLSNINNLSRKELLLFGTVIFSLKILMVLVINTLDWSEGISFYTNAGDDGQYIGYSENLYQTGEYFYDFGNSGIKNHFFRMPGITFLYYPFRFLFNQVTTINLIVIAQVLLSTCAVIKFLKLINKYLKINNFFFVFFSVFYLYSSFLESSLMTESLGVSSLILCLYYTDVALSANIKNDILRNLAIGGFFLMWMIFLRPFMLPFLLLLTFYVLFKKRRMFYVIIFTLPFLIVDGLWTFRNYYYHNEVVFLQRSLNWFDNGNKSLKSKVVFIKSFGFGWVNFEENSEATWFNNQYEASSVKIPPNSIFPKRTFVGDLSMDSLVKARSLMHQVVNEDLDNNLRIKSDLEAARILDKFVYTLKKEKPFDYYILNRVRLLFSFLEPNTPKLFIHGPYPLNILVSKIDVLFSCLIKYLGFLGLILIFIINLKKMQIHILFLSVPIYLFILFPFILRIDETRFFYLSSPFLTIGLIYFFMKIEQLFRYSFNKLL